MVALRCPPSPPPWTIELPLRHPITTPQGFGCLAFKTAEYHARYGTKTAHWFVCEDHPLRTRRRPWNEAVGKGEKKGVKHAVISHHASQQCQQASRCTVRARNRERCESTGVARVMLSRRNARAASTPFLWWNPSASLLLALPFHFTCARNFTSFCGMTLRYSLGRLRLGPYVLNFIRRSWEVCMCARCVNALPVLFGVAPFFFLLILRRWACDSRWWKVHDLDADGFLFCSSGGRCAGLVRCSTYLIRLGMFTVP